MAASLAEFMRRVVPWPSAGAQGVINAHWTLPDPNIKAMPGKPFAALSDMLGFIPWANNHPKWMKDIYFCLSLQAETGLTKTGKIKAARHANAALALKALWLDVDGYKDYPSKTVALAAIYKFVMDAGLPLPTALVDSGGGWHVYWISDRPLTTAEWEPYADGLWALVQKHGLKADSVTTDAARVLRLPTTYNKKQLVPRLVEIKLLQDSDIDFTATLGWLTKIAPPRAVTLPQGNNSPVIADPKLFPQKSLSGPPDKLGDNIEEPLNLKAILRCPHYKDALRTGGKDHNQGLWMQTVLGATWIENPREVAHALSNKHPGYSVEECDAMFDRKMNDRAKGLGWPSCDAFERNGCTSCALCPHKGKIRSPLNLGRPDPPPPSVPIGTLSTAPVHTQTPTALNLPPYLDGVEVVIRKWPPYGNCIGIMKKPRKEDGDPYFSPLFLCEIWEPAAFRGPDTIQFMASMSKGHASHITIHQANMGSAQALMNEFAAQSVKVKLNNKEIIADFMQHWIGILHAMKEADQSVPFGWVVNDGKRTGFAFAGEIHHGTSVSNTSEHADGKMREMYTPCGDEAVWRQAMALITDQNRPAVEVIAAASFASPLLPLTGRNAGVICGHSQSGGNKSSACIVGAAVWGSPIDTKEVATASTLGLMKRMAETRNLPIYWDDISQPARMEKVVYVTSDATEGKQGTKLKNDGTMRDSGKWQNIIIVSSNRSVFDEFVKMTRDNAAGVNRIFEFEVDIPPETPERIAAGPAATRLLDSLNNNFGRIGEKYAAVLGRDPAALDKWLEQLEHRFAKRVNMRQDERFWVSICACILGGAMLAKGTLGVDFHLSAMEEFLVDAYAKMRARVKSEALIGTTKENTENSLAEFLNDHNSEIVITEAMPEPKPGRPAEQNVIYGPNENVKGWKLFIQFSKSERVCMINKKAFRDYMDKHNHQMSVVMGGLKKYFQMEEIKLPLGSGTTYRQSPAMVLKIPVPVGSWLEDRMNAKTYNDQLAHSTPITHSDQSAAALVRAGNVLSQPK